MDDKIKLFGFWRSAATYRVRIALALKGLAFEETSLDVLAGEQFEQISQLLIPKMRCGID